MPLAGPPGSLSIFHLSHAQQQPWTALQWQVGGFRKGDVVEGDESSLESKLPLAKGCAGRANPCAYSQAITPVGHAA